MGEHTVTTVEPREGPTPMAAGDWYLLLAQIEEGKVVPVVGRDLLAIGGPGGPTFYYRDLALRLAADLGVAASDLPKEPDVEDVAFAYLRGSRSEWDMLYSRLRMAVRAFRPELPEALRQLAAIEPIRLFVSTTYDDLLSCALREGRRSAKVIERAYLPSASTSSSQDLPASLDGDAATVYSLFGRPDEAGDYAVTEEDTLELVHQLKVKLDPAQGELRNLGARLGQSHLLFLGCGFPDWLMRFFIRTLRGERFHTERPRKRARVADRRAAPDGPLVMFLQQYGTRVYTGTPVEFVAELSRRWEERRRPEVVKHTARSSAAATAHVVLACAAEDEGSARDVAERLTSWGIGWAIVRFRETDEATLRARLEACAVVVAYLSKGLLGDGPDGRLLDDWQWVEKRRRDASPGTLSAFVVTLDGTAREKLRDSRGWPDWLRRSRRLSAADVASSVVDAMFESGRLGARPRVQAYFAVANEDRTSAEELERQLAGVKGLTVWHPGKIRPGEDRLARKAAERAASQVLVLFVSADLLKDGSDEIREAMERHRGGTAVVIPILARPCMVDDALRELDFLPDDGEAISLARDADLAWTTVAKAIVLRTFDFLLSQREKEQRP